MNSKQRQLQLAADIANRHEDLHPWEVAVEVVRSERRADFNAFLIGLLHDAIEDKHATHEEVSKNFPNEVYECVVHLTRRVDEGEAYWDYIDRLKEAPSLARKVKIADATVNLERCQRSFGYTGLERRYRRVLDELT